MFNLRVIESKNCHELHQEMSQIGVGSEGIRIMLDKGQFVVLRADSLSTPAALILKQELLAVGGEAAVHRQVIVQGVEHSSVLLMATKAQYRKLCVKLNLQQFKLPVLAAQIEQVLFGKKYRLIRGKKKTLHCGEKTLIMGILNVTPDSFYDGGEFLDPGAAVEQALNLAASGADIIDIGGASSRPGFQAVTAEEELARILPVIKRVSSLIDQPLSVDTEKAEVAAAALDAGASIINDITGLQAPDMVDIAAQTGAPVVIMHNSRGLEHGDDLMGEILCFFRDKITQVQAKGVQEEQIIIDPGLGFGKDTRQNLVILHHLSQLKSLPYPLLIAASQKRFIGDVLDLPLEKRLSGSTAVATLSAAGGAEIVRVHNVLEVKQALKIADAIRRGAK